MKAKEYLRRGRNKDAEIMTIIERIKELHGMAISTTSVMNSERVQSSGEQQKMAACVAKMVDMQAQLLEEVNKLLDLKEEIRQMICEACDADCIRLLSLKYLGVYEKTNEHETIINKSDDVVKWVEAISAELKRVKYYNWEQIAVDMSYTYKWVSGGLHQKALSQVQKVLDEKGVRNESEP